MKIPVLKFLVAAFLFLSAVAVTSVEAQFPTTALFTVDHTGDSHDANVGDNICADADGKCTLRAAIEEANFNPFQDGINFALPTFSTINLTLGELPITSNVYIAGPGARKLIVQRSTAQGTPDFRIFSINFTDGFVIPVTIRGLSIKNGRTGTDGGGIYINYSTTVHLIDVAVIGNTSAGSGAGIFNAGTINIKRSLIASNNANGLFSGGLLNITQNTNSVISDSTLTNNSGNQGGAINNSGNLLLVNNTISHNTATGGGSSILNNSTGNVSVLNTIIGMDVSSPTSSLSGTFISLGNNLVTDARNSTGFTNGANGDQVSDNNAINPLLGALADNGGQTDTRALLEGSPAINKGNSCVYYRNCPQPVPQGFSLVTDQRLVFLRLGGSSVDVGAFENEPFSFSAYYALGGFSLNNRSGGSLITLIEAGTNQRQSRVTNTFGGFLFNDLNYWEVYFLERKPKRAGQRRGVTVHSLDSLPVLVPLPVVPNGEEVKMDFTLRDKVDK